MRHRRQQSKIEVAYDGSACYSRTAAAFAAATLPPSPVDAGREDTSISELISSAVDLARDNPTRFPNESAEYRAARNLLLVEEIELRRRIERVAALRRALPPGGDVKGDYRFIGEDGPTDFVGLFANKTTLVAYSYMFGPGRERPCPMCTNLLGSWDGTAPDIEQSVSLVVIARSPIERLAAFKRERGWKHLRLYSDVTGDYSRDYFGVSADGSDLPAQHVFTRREGIVRHFWSAEMGDWTADPGQDPRGAPDASPLWTVLDCTPEGRHPDWYPQLAYDADASTAPANVR